MRFRAEIERQGRTATVIAVPGEVVATLGPSRHAPVRVTVGGLAYRTRLASRGGRHLVALSAEHRLRAGVVAGDEVEVEIERDDDPRVVPVPADLAQALEADPAVRRAFRGLPSGGQRRRVTEVERARAGVTRRRRIAQTVDTLRDAA